MNKMGTKNGLKHEKVKKINLGSTPVNGVSNTNQLRINTVQMSGQTGQTVGQNNDIISDDLMMSRMTSTSRLTGWVNMIADIIESNDRVQRVTRVTRTRPGAGSDPGWVDPDENAQIPLVLKIKTTPLSNTI